MACRTNLKKDKRLRNRINAFRFKKGPTFKRRFTGPDYAAEQKKADEDNKFYSLVSAAARGTVTPSGILGSGTPDLPCSSCFPDPAWDQCTANISRKPCLHPTSDCDVDVVRTDVHLLRRGGCCCAGRGGRSGQIQVGCARSRGLIMLLLHPRAAGTRVMGCRRARAHSAQHSQRTPNYTKRVDPLGTAPWSMHCTAHSLCPPSHLVYVYGSRVSRRR